MQNMDLGLDVASTETRLEEALKAVRGKSDARPAVALVLGSGLGAFADTLDAHEAIDYRDIPGIPASKVEGHKGNLVFGKVGATPVVAMQGRAHLYEGHHAHEIVFGVRLMAKLGACNLLITNAAGGISSALEVGDLMLISDHLNLTGTNSLLGPNLPSLGPRFPDMTEAYDARLRALADEQGKKLGFSLKSGVYAGLLGPTYETPAEIKMLQVLGAQAVGMSTVLEVIAARHMGVRCLGISCITNLAAGLSDQTLDHSEVQEVANRVHDRFVSLLREIIPAMATV